MAWHHLVITKIIQLKLVRICQSITVLRNAIVATLGKSYKIQGSWEFFPEVLCLPCNPVIAATLNVKGEHRGGVGKGRIAFFITVLHLVHSCSLTCKGISTWPLFTHGPRSLHIYGVVFCLCCYFSKHSWETYGPSLCSVLFTRRQLLLTCCCCC